MRLVILVATPDRKMEALVAQRREQLIPEHFRKDSLRLLGVSDVAVSCYRQDTQDIQNELLKHVGVIITKSDVGGLIVLTDTRLPPIAEDVKKALFTFVYTGDGLIRSPSNFFGSMLSRVLNDYGALASRYSQKKSRKLLTLPRQNFQSAELQLLFDICSATVGTPGFPQRIDDCLTILQKRQKPKRYSDSSRVYLVDDASKHFELGHEHHARADTAQPPHNDVCLINTHFRFGCRLDQEIHFNVSMPGKHDRMASMYPDCHGHVRSGEGKTHLNMFPSDFF